MNQVYLDQFTHHEKVKFLVQKKRTIISLTLFEAGGGLFSPPKGKHP